MRPAPNMSRLYVLGRRIRRAMLGPPTISNPYSGGGTDPRVAAQLEAILEHNKREHNLNVVLVVLTVAILILTSALVTLTIVLVSRH